MKAVVDALQEVATPTDDIDHDAAKLEEVSRFASPPD